MRPLRLELAGFTAFREPEEIDFTDADLFALVGPTGSGKSSLIDAMCFACYGTVPRLDRRKVEPVISAGKLEARVRFDFAVGDRAYSAVRVVRRMRPGRATTKEARLESGEKVLAGDADAVTAKVEELLGFGFEQFTKCVVLPQGEFARFLHDPPRARQDLLVQLLDLGVFEEMHEAAQTRRAQAETRRQLGEQRLEDLADATDEVLATAEERITRLEELRDELDAADPRLADLATKVTQAEQRARTASEQAQRLAAVAVPDGVAELATDISEVEAVLADAGEALQAAGEAVEEATVALADLGDKAQLVAWREAHTRRQKLADRIAKGEPIIAQARADEDRTRRELAEAERTVAEAAEALQRLRDEHAAAHLAAGLAVGEPCPVCEQPVQELPKRAAPADLEQAEQALKRARQQCSKRQNALQAAQEEHIKLVGRLDGLRLELGEVDQGLGDAPDRDAVETQLGGFATAEAAVNTARKQERNARTAAHKAEQAVRAIQEREREAWEQFHRTRDTVAALAPPPVDRADLGRAWETLATWAQETASTQQGAAEAAQQEVGDLRADQEALHEKLQARCAEAGVEVGDRRLRDACAEALAQARAEHTRVASDVETAAKLRTEVGQAAEQEAVAGALARHLTATGFERWLLDEALDRLIDGASRVLRELSDGQYSLAMDDQRNFAVVDHRNADERRPAKTLSGGETFLASLALALTLAEHLAELAVDSAPRLEAIFLDEGFGSLDMDTLDLVATAIEELGSTGRVVGIVTHVRELAERVPVRYEVRKGPSTSTVERVTP